MEKELILGGSTVLAALITGAFGAYSRNKNNQIAELQSKLTQAENMLEAEAAVMKFEHDFAFNLRTATAFEKLCETSEIDRILMLIAWNGEGAPQWTKTEYQYRYGEQEKYNFVHTRLDDDYRAKLNSIQHAPEGILYHTGELAPGSLIHGIYDVEKVLASYWTFLRKVKYEKGTCYSYFSFATHNEETICPQTIFRIRLLMDEIRASANFNTGHMNHV